MIEENNHQEQEGQEAAPEYDNIVPMETEEPEQPEEQAVEAEAQQPQRDYEEEAKQMGWRPKEEFRGSPDDWRDAETYVKRGEEFLPIVRSQLRKTEQQLNETASRLEASEKDFALRLKRIENANQKALEKQRLQMAQEIRRQQREAVKFGDEDRYDELAEQELDLYRDLEPEEEPVKEAQPQQAPAPKEVVEWANENPWFGSDMPLTHYAVEIDAKLSQDAPYMDDRERLARTKEMVQQRFPEKFGISQSEPEPAIQQGISPVEGGQRNATARNNAKGWNELPGEAKAAGQRFVADGTYKSKDEYAKDYWSQS